MIAKLNIRYIIIGFMFIFTATNSVFACNSIPIADISYTVLRQCHNGNSFTFDGSESEDPDGGDIVEYKWIFWAADAGDAAVGVGEADVFALHLLGESGGGA